MQNNEPKVKTYQRLGRSEKHVKMSSDNIIITSGSIIVFSLSLDFLLNKNIFDIPLDGPIGVCVPYNTVPVAIFLFFYFCDDFRQF